jgi:hypothetical protein
MVEAEVRRALLESLPLLGEDEFYRRLDGDARSR